MTPLSLDRSPDVECPPWPAYGAARHDRLGELASRLSRTLALARALIQSGRTLDLTGVDDGVGLLCAQTLDLPTEAARALLPALRDVLAQLDQLSLALHAHVRSGARRC